MSVPVQDMGRAKRFYSETLGLEQPETRLLHRRYAP